VPEHDSLLVGILIGLIIGLPVGMAIAFILRQVQLASVVFDRDEQGRIVAIHYVPGAGRVG
jgi:Na+/H+ antiporter NhaA